MPADDTLHATNSNFNLMFLIDFVFYRKSSKIGWKHFVIKELENNLLYEIYYSVNIYAYLTKLGKRM